MKHILDEHGMCDIYGMWYRPWWQRTEFRYACNILAIVGVLSVLYIIARWYKKRISTKTLNPWERALRDLAALQPIVLSLPDNIDMIQGRAVHRFDALFYDQVSVILKKYVHDRFGYVITNNSTNNTDWEVIAYLKTLEISQEAEREVIAYVIDVLQGGYYVKFAGQRMVTEQIERHYAMSVEVIKKTIPHVSQ